MATVVEAIVGAVFRLGGTEGVEKFLLMMDLGQGL